MAERKSGKRKKYDDREWSVLRIMHRIAMGTWIPGVSEHGWAERSGASLLTVQQYAREASSRIAAGVILDETLRNSLIVQFQTNAAIGQQLVKMARDEGRFGDAIGALRAKNESLKAVAAIRAADKPKGPVTDDDLSGKSERELLEIIALSSVKKLDKETDE